MSRTVPAVGLTMAIAGALALAPASAFAAEGGSNGDADGWVVVGTQIDGDSYKREVFNDGIGWGPKRIDAHCPDDFPYLDATQGTPGLSVGRGLVVGVDSGVTVVEDPGARIGEQLSFNEVIYKGTTLVPWNHDAFNNRGFSVTMFCTSSKTKGWTQLIRVP